MNRTLLRHPALLALLLTTTVSVAASAETVYRRVDPDGNVSFSSTPPAPGEKAEAIEVDTSRNVIAPERTPAAQRFEAEARQRQQQTQRELEREQRNRSAELDAAEERLQRAIKAREAGQALQPGDRIGRKEGGTRPSLQRIERLQRLDADVEAAEQELQRLRQGQ
jgi:hypothetical protein